mmetsp:Transcript_116863/g.372041  ORF Transcript_116863/g.372041 Transcript_116863/m.372041 type:complete len:1310 (-) Transcript_116863:62-3991(-)
MASSKTGRRSASPLPTEDDDRPRTLRTVFQRRCPEEQAMRRTAIAELVREASEPFLHGLDQDDRSRSGLNTEGFGPPPGGGMGARLRAPLAHSLDGPMRFSSSFECGNLLMAKLVVTGQGGSSSSTAQAGKPSTASTAAGDGAESAGDGPDGSQPSAGADDGNAAAHPQAEVEYDLFLDSDTQSSAGHTQWFYFAVRTHDFRGRAHFRIVNLRKRKSLYQQGMQPHCYSLRRNKGWEPFSCEDIAYIANSDLPAKFRRKNGDETIKPDLNTLAFSYNVTQLDDEIYFAAYPPYSYTMMSRFLGQLHGHAHARRHFQRSELCRSIGQLPVPALVISQDIAVTPDIVSNGLEGGPTSVATPSPSVGAEGFERGRPRGPRPAIAVIARQHPGEVVGSWSVQGFLKFILGPSAIARKLREAYVFHVVPMVNVDGVVHGNSRCTLAGVDPNRVWHDPNPIIHPVVYALKQYLRNVAQGSGAKGIELFLDMHGHSAKFGCFFYGSNPLASIANAVFPKLCEVATRDISFEQCHWRCSRSHRKTARYVVYKQIGVKYAYTMECSLFAPVGWSSRKMSPPASAAMSPVSMSPEGSDEDAPAERARDYSTAHFTPPNAHFTPERVEWIGFAVGCAAATFLNVQADLVAGEEGPVDEDGEQGQCQCHRISRECHCENSFMPDVRCPQVLARRPWSALPLLESTSFNEVLEDLSATYGDTVPDFARYVQGDASDGGDSDGDDLPELEPLALAPESETVGAQRGKGSKDQPPGPGVTPTPVALGPCTASAVGAVPPRPPRGKAAPAREPTLRLAVSSKGSSVGGSCSQPPPVGAGRAVGSSAVANGNAASGSAVAANVVGRGVVGLPNAAAPPSVMVGRRVRAVQSATVNRSRSVDQRSGSPSDLFAGALPAPGGGQSWSCGTGPQAGTLNIAHGPKMQWPPALRMDAKSTVAGRAEKAAQFWMEEGSRNASVNTGGNTGGASLGGTADYPAAGPCSCRNTPSPSGAPSGPVGAVPWEGTGASASMPGEWVSFSSGGVAGAAGMVVAEKSPGRRPSTVVAGGPGNSNFGVAMASAASAGRGGRRPSLDMPDSIAMLLPQQGRNGSALGSGMLPSMANVSLAAVPVNQLYHLPPGALDDFGVVGVSGNRRNPASRGGGGSGCGALRPSGARGTGSCGGNAGSVTERSTRHSPPNVEPPRQPRSAPTLEGSAARQIQRRGTPVEGGTGDEEAASAPPEQQAFLASRPLASVRKAVPTAQGPQQEMGTIGAGIAPFTGPARSAGDAVNPKTRGGPPVGVEERRRDSASGRDSATGQRHRSGEAS